jgi:NMD protein affecting ribosome stability and mRNA decay
MKCVICGEEYKESELVDGICPDCQVSIVMTDGIPPTF